MPENYQNFDALSDLSDAELLQHYLEGDANAFSVLIKKYQGALFGYLAKLTGDKTAAEDIFQETFIKVFRNASQFQSGKRFKPWLYAIAVNAARDYMRSASRQSKPADYDESYQSADIFEQIPAKILPPEKILVNREHAQTVQDTVALLPLDLREVLILSYFAQLPHREIAEIMDLPTGTVKSRLHRALATFSHHWNRLCDSCEEEYQNECR